MRRSIKKKAISLFLCIALLFVNVVPSFADEEKKIDSVEISTSSSIEEEPIADIEEEKESELNSDEEEKSESTNLINEKIDKELKEIKEASESIVEENFYGDDLVSTESEVSEEDPDDEKRRSGLLPVKTKVGRVKVKSGNLFGDATLPESYDARNEQNASGLSIVPPIRDQNPYGTCWAFSTIGMVETSIRMKNLVSTDDESDLSEAALSYFTLNLKDVTNSSDIDTPGVEGHDYMEVREEYFDDLSEANFADGGGNQMEALLMASTYMGVVKEDDNTSYDMMANIKTSGLDGRYAFNSNDFEVKNVQLINKNDIDLIKKAIMENGSVGVNYYEKREANNCHEHNGEYYYLADKGKDATHAVMIVGWNDNVSKDWFSISNKPSQKVLYDGAWLIRNSWGDSNTRMKNGFFWMSYYDHSYETPMYTIEAMEKDTYKYNYHYDTTGVEVYFNANTPFGNIYKVSDEEDQILDAINIPIESTNSKFNIEIYKSDSVIVTPSAGTKVYTQSVEKNYPGIWTIDLDKDILLPRNTYFSVVIKPQNQITVFCDNTRIGDEDVPRNYYNASRLSQSLYMDGNKWVDLNCAGLQYIDGDYYGANFRIRALTNSAPKIEFNPSGGTGEMVPQGAITDTDVKLKYNTYKKDGYIFAGWEDTEGNTYADGETIHFDGEITLSAMWEEGHNITYLPGDGSGFMQVQGVKLGESAKLNKNLFTRNGYSFYNWRGSDGKTYSNEQNIGVLDSDITLTAYWVRNYTPSYSGRSSGGGGGGGGGGYISGGGMGDSSILAGTMIASGAGGGGPETAQKVEAAISAMPVNNNTSNSTWKVGTNGKWQLTYVDANGNTQVAKNQWAVMSSMVNINGVMTKVDSRYFFDANGNMVTGWLTDATNKKYYFNEKAGAEQGKMSIGWRELAGGWYYFKQDGSMMESGVTPDGYTIGNDGKWVH